jgi:hypothetical protein
MTPNELLKLKTAFLKRSLKKQLVDRSGYTRRQVNYVLNGDRENENIIAEAVKILDERKSIKIKL